MSKYSVSQSGIDSFLWDVERAVYAKIGDTRKTENTISALVWYVNTGRASCDFLRELFTFSPRVVANSLMKGGSDFDKIERIKKALSRKEKKKEV